MRLLIFALFILAPAIFAAPSREERDSKAAPGCVVGTSPCALPNCRCASTDVPGGFTRAETPQIILLTFDDAVNVVNYANIYQKLIFNRANPNGCPIKATYFLTHEYNNYTLVNELYKRGHELASHSITHRTNSTFWAQNDTEHWKKEMIDMRTMISSFAGGIPISDVKGARAPFLLMGGNEMFQVYKDNNMEYDCTWATRNYVNPALWPYTLDYRSIQECPVGRCPDESFPGQWVIPMTDLFDRDGNPCAMLDACQMGSTRDQVFDKLMENFYRHYNSTRAPFGLFLHAAWLETKANYDGYEKFLDEMLNFDDVYFTSLNQLLDWVKSPVSLSDLNNFQPWQCRSQPPDLPCANRDCGYPPDRTPFNVERFMGICNIPCPAYYPWYENIDGANPPTPFP